MSPAPRWPVVLFDFDGTLLNTIDGIVASYIYTWQTVSGRQVVRSEILPWIGRTLADVFATHPLGSRVGIGFADHGLAIVGEAA